MTGVTLMDQMKKNQQTKKDWLEILSKQNLIKNLQKKFIKILNKNFGAKKSIYDIVSNMITDPDKNSAYNLLKTFQEDASFPEHPFNEVTFTHNVVMTNDYLLSEDEARNESTLRQTCILSNNLIFNGYLNNLYNEISRFYYGNNLVLAWNYDPSSPYTYNCDLFVDDSRTLLIEVEDGQIKTSKLLIKGNKINQEGNRNIYYKFHKNTWMVKRSSWVHILKPFLGPHSEGCNFFILFNF